MAAAALSPVFVTSTQDVSRLCLTRALVHGTFVVDDCVGDTIDRSRYGGHLYSNKAPGMSVLALPSAEAVRLPPPARWRFEGDLRLWVVRVLTGGLAFLAAAFLVGRVSEGLTPGAGGAALVTFALGTLMAPLAASTFDHGPAAALGFAAFLLAWSRRRFAAGLAAGAAVLVEYQASAIVALVGLYVLLHGGRALARYVLGVLPGAALLALYDWIAFGAPWHNPLSYSDNVYGERSFGLLGIGSPSADSIRRVFLADRGLLVTSPVLVAAAAGLWLLWRRGLRAEAAAATAIAAAFVAASCSYFDPYGGIAPGPRYLVPALPFLALGLGPAFARWRLPTLALAAVSVVATTAVTLTWAMSEGRDYRGTVWGEIGRLATERGDARLVDELAKNVLVWAGPSRLVAAAAVAACAAFALVASLRRG